jgi:hypothetical protein
MAWGSDHCGFTTSSLQLHQEHPVKWWNAWCRNHKNPPVKPCEWCEWIAIVFASETAGVNIRPEASGARQLLRHCLRGLPSAQPLVGFGTGGFVAGVRSGRGGRWSLDKSTLRPLSRTKWFFKRFQRGFCAVFLLLIKLVIWLLYVTALGRVWH